MNGGVLLDKLNSHLVYTTSHFVTQTCCMNKKCPSFLDANLFPSATLGKRKLPIEVHALLPEVPMFILVQFEHFNPKWHIHPPSMSPLRTVARAVLGVADYNQRLELVRRANNRYLEKDICSPMFCFLGNYKRFSHGPSQNGFKVVAGREIRMINMIF